MYKNILIAFLIALFAGCSAPKPQEQPTWFTNPPQDYENIYAVASAKDERKATNIAINRIRQNINSDMNALFMDVDNKLSPNSERLKEIIRANKELTHRFSMRGIKKEKTELFDGEIYILISINRAQLFEKLQQKIEKEFKDTKEKYSKNRALTNINRYLYIKPLMAHYTYLACVTGAKKVVLPSFNPTSDFIFLKELSDEYTDLLASINFYILSDVDSRKYAQIIRDALKSEHLSATTLNKEKKSNSLTLLISSDVINSQEYTFMVTKHLVDLTTFDANKNKIAFTQHTFVAKSRRGYKDAAQQAALHLQSKIKKLGIFNFIGLEND